jgi:superfamily I DNA and/or RNA helicase
MTHAGAGARQVSTVDAFQGSEKEVIIVTCVRTTRLGFIDSPKRLNVTLTRAKRYAYILYVFEASDGLAHTLPRHLILVGNGKVLAGNRTWHTILSYIEVRLSPPPTALCGQPRVV